MKRIYEFSAYPVCFLAELPTDYEEGKKLMMHRSNAIMMYRPFLTILKPGEIKQLTFTWESKGLLKEPYVEDKRTQEIVAGQAFLLTRRINRSLYNHRWSFGPKTTIYEILTKFASLLYIVYNDCELRDYEIHPQDMTVNQIRFDFESETQTVVFGLGRFKTDFQGE